MVGDVTLRGSRAQPSNGASTCPPCPTVTATVFHIFEHLIYVLQNKITYDYHFYLSGDFTSLYQEDGTNKFSILVNLLDVTDSGGKCAVAVDKMDLNLTLQSLASNLPLDYSLAEDTNSILTAAQVLSLRWCSKLV